MILLRAVIIEREEQRCVMSAGERADVVCIGQAVVDCITRDIRNIDGGTAEIVSSGASNLTAGSVGIRTGGDAMNQSAVLSSLGLKAELMCVLGNDLAGDIVFSEAVKRGVGVSAISRCDDIMTPVANIVVREDGSRYSVSSTAARLTGYTPKPGDIPEARVLSLASIFRAPIDRPEVIRDILLEAKRRGMTVCADTKLPTFRRTSLNDLRDTLPLIDYIFPNEKEAAYYTGQQDLRSMAEVILGYGVKNVVIKAGEEGCLAANADGFFTVPAVPVKVLDTTGAGDNFVAGFISGLLSGRTFHECCVTATRQAAASIVHEGAV